MFNYMKIQCRDTFITIPEACEFLGLTKDELRSKCEQYGVRPYNWDGQWGFPSEHFRQLNNTLYFEQCRDGCDDSRIFADTPAKCAKKYDLPQQPTSALSPIDSIRGLEPTYTVAEACALLQVTQDELEKICTESNLLMIQNLDGTWYITCYDYLILNNILYHKQCAASREENDCL